jgi:hypothetical protein
MKIAIAGDIVGITPAQAVAVSLWLGENGVDIEEAHHGAMQGGDAEMARVVLRVLEGCEIHAHPARTTARNDNDSILMAHVKHKARQSVKRTWDVVDAGDVLLACPSSEEEDAVYRSWFCVRYALSKGKRAVVFLPDGTVLEKFPQPTLPE